jgi:translation elongation factor EF-4
MGMKGKNEAQVGDTFYVPNSNVTALPGFRSPKHMVYAGIYPTDPDQIDQLNDAISKLMLTDASVSVTKEQSDALGVGFRCGFLGILHLDVFTQRIEQEYGIETITTAPSVPYKCRVSSFLLLMAEFYYSGNERWKRS